MKDEKVDHKQIVRYSKDKGEVIVDHLAIEEPLQISITALGQSKPVHEQNIAVTMRTPGDDTHLALGFLFGEGIIRIKEDIKLVKCEENFINIYFNDSIQFDPKQLERNFYTTSSCGICGKASIEAVRTFNQANFEKPFFQADPKILKSLPQKLKSSQSVFSKTGGLHAASLFDLSGTLIHVAEDIGRHNALDKLIGYTFNNAKLPLNRQLLLLSGRASFELVQKAAMAGIQFVLAVGAPSSLAVELAIEFDITLIGFLSEDRFNIYHGEKRILL